jgi:hypothetical protein
MNLHFHQTRGFRLIFTLSLILPSVSLMAGLRAERHSGGPRPIAAAEKLQRPGKGEGPLSGPLGAADVAREFVELAKPWRIAKEQKK